MTSKRYFGSIRQRDSGRWQIRYRTREEEESYRARDCLAGFRAAVLEQGLLNYVNGLSAAQKAQPIAVVWLHSEYDSSFPGLTPANATKITKHQARPHNNHVGCVLLCDLCGLCVRHDKKT